MTEHPYTQPPGDGIATNVVSLASVRQSRDYSVEVAWCDYVAAQTKAKETLSLDDGLAAGRAWRLFLDMFAKAG